jgi:hypothetical protein
MNYIVSDPNAVRAARVEQILKTSSPEPDLHTNLVDLLADAMHWCDLTGQDFHLALAQACRHYLNEFNDQQLDERRLIP